MTKRQKLELTWIGKENRPKLEPRILLEDPSMSYHAAQRVTDGDIFDSRLIFGDNLLALKALEQEFAGKVKCVYIDPPFNTQQALEHYDDGIEHSLWLSLMRDRLELIRSLLDKSGTLFVHIDDNEIAYLSVLLDEVFGRANKLYVVTFKQGSATGHKSINPGCVSTTNFILLYAKDKSSWVPNKVYTARGRDPRYGQFIPNRHERHKNWTFDTLANAFAASLNLSVEDSRKADRYQKKLDQFVIDHASEVVRLARPSYNDVGAAARKMIDISKRFPARVLRLTRKGYSDMYFLGGQRILFYADKVKVIDGVATTAEPLTTLWDDILSNNLHKEGGVKFPKGKKPEALIKRVLELCTNPGDLVLDSFAGSGTTGAVAQKMGRRWLMVELGDQCHTHVIPRLKSVINGEDSSGATKAMDWKGGGGFRYYRLAPSLLEKDHWGNWVINREYNAGMLAEALCKLEGFTYAPSDSVYWQHGHSTERDFLYVTTASLTHEQLQQLNDEVGPERSLLVLCTAFRARANAYKNLTVRKIPKQVLSHCEWGHDDYSLQVENLPQAPREPDQQGLFEDGGAP
ncbi:MAG: site-specific DNA-methyltransferase [Rhodanobacteraceae bacterium]|nr:MAG: site-specific DNA-methyltransferase [Rhodanobacteraceae bacterium]